MSGSGPALQRGLYEKWTRCPRKHIGLNKIIVIQSAFKKKCSERITYSEPILGKGYMGQKPRFWQRKNPENQWF